MISNFAILIAAILFSYLFFVIFKFKNFWLQLSSTIMIIVFAFLSLTIVVGLAGSDKPVKWIEFEEIIYPVPDKMKVLSDYTAKGILYIWLLDPISNKPIFMSLPDPDKKKTAKLQREKAKVEKSGGSVYFTLKDKTKKTGNKNSSDKKQKQTHDGEGDAEIGNFEAEIQKGLPSKSPFIIDKPETYIPGPPDEEGPR